MSWESVSGSYSHGSGGNMNGMCSVGTHSEGKKGCPVMRITLCQEAMSAMRFVIGDKVDVDIDKATRKLRVKRNPIGKSSLCPTVGKISDNAGKVANCSIQITIKRELLAMLPKSSVRCSWLPDSDGLVIRLP